MVGKAGWVGIHDRLSQKFLIRSITLFVARLYGGVHTDVSEILLLHVREDVDHHRSQEMRQGMIGNMPSPEIRLRYAVE